MKLGWLNGSMRLIPENKEERKALITVFYALGEIIPHETIEKGVDEGFDNEEDDPSYLA